MTTEQAMKLLHAAVARVHSAGYVVNGELVFCRPKFGGIVESKATGFMGEPCRLLVQTVPPLGSPVPAPNPEPLPELQPTAVVPDGPSNLELEAAARANGFTGDLCASCHSAQVVRKGTCLYCLNCGQSGGCS